MSDAEWNPFTGDFVDIEHWRRELDRLHDPSMVAFLLRSAPAVIAAGLDEMAWGLAHEYGCRNDIIGLLDYLEKWQNEERDHISSESNADCPERMTGELEAKLGVTWDEALEMHVPVGDPVCACPINRRLERIDARARDLLAEVDLLCFHNNMTALIEVKQPNAELRPGQVEFMEKIMPYLDTQLMYFVMRYPGDADKLCGGVE